MLVDNREPKDLIDLLKQRIDLKIAQLPLADYIINNDFAIERKTRLDFERSIIDRRLFKQILELKNRFNRVLLIVEGTENNLDKNILLGTYASLISSNVSIFFTRNKQSTADLIYSIYKHEYTPKRDLSIVQKRALTFSESLVSVVELFPLIGPKHARSLLDYFGSLKDLINASKEDLLEVEGIGEKRARVLFNFFNTIYDKKEDRYRRR